MNTGQLITGLLGILFVGLKLSGIISWSWLWVTAPFWWPLAIACVLFAFSGACYLAARFF